MNRIPAVRFSYESAVREAKSLAVVRDGDHALASILPIGERDLVEEALEGRIPDPWPIRRRRRSDGLRGRRTGAPGVRADQ